MPKRLTTPTLIQTAPSGGLCGAQSLSLSAAPKLPPINASFRNSIKKLINTTVSQIAHIAIPKHMLVRAFLGKNNINIKFWRKRK